MAARSKARKRALDILYEADIRRVPADLVLQEQVDRRAADSEPPLNPYVSELISGVEAHRERIDELIGTYATGWSLARMPAVDRAILRVGAYEVLWQHDLAEAVAIAEAVALAQELSTDESAPFVNGLLARLAELKPRLDLDQ
jgi:N utilization substance protein B